MAGSYRTKLTIQVSGTASAPITIRSDVAQKAIIDGTKIASEVVLNYGSYINIVGFEVINGTRNGIVDFGAYGRIEGNLVHGILALCDSTGGAGIVTGTTTGGNKLIIRNTVYNIGAEKCVEPKLNTVHGIYLANRDNTVQNNIVYNVGACGIHTWHAASRGIISNNLSFNNGRCGIIIGSGDNQAGTIAEKFVVSNNIVVNNGDLGIYESGAVGVNQYLNNLSWGNKRLNWMLKNGNVSINGLSVDPQFVNYLADGSGDYRLKTTSPALGKGTSLGLPTTDFLSLTRLNKPMDLGPYQISQ